MDEDCGIYTITNLESGKQYIGSTAYLYRRFKEHLSKLRKGKHPNPKLQNAWDKYGEAAFKFDVLERCEDAKTLALVEQKWIDTVKPFYNCFPTARSSLGHSVSAEARAKISAANKGRQTSLGRKHSDETKKKISAARLGKTAHNKGQPMSKEQKAKLSQAKRGKPAWNKGLKTKNGDSRN